MADELVVRDQFSHHILCWHSECQWGTGEGVSGIEAKYEDADGRPVCWDHYTSGEGAE